MSQISYDITLYNSPGYENLITELYRISRYKRNIYKKIRTEEEFNKKLSYDDKAILNDLTKKENEVLLEILTNKMWLGLPLDYIEYLSKKLKNKFHQD